MTPFWMRSRVAVVGGLLSCLLLASFGMAQSKRKQGEHFGQKSFDELQAALKENPAASHVIHALRIKGDKRAIPLLKEALAKVGEKKPRQDIARALIELGDKEDIAWPIIEEYGRAAIESDMPTPLVFDDKGQIIRGEKNPKFLEWCQAKGINPNLAFDQYVYQFQTDVELLGLSDDKRAVPLLLKGLDSANPWIAARAAMGLARLQFKDAVQPIIAACARVTPELASAIAQALVFFDTSEAQAAADKYVKSKAILESRRKQAKAKGPKGIFKEF